jgi:hypothetical protein
LGGTRLSHEHGAGNRQVDTAEISTNASATPRDWVASADRLSGAYRAGARGLSAAGIDAVMLSFVNFKQELPFFIERVVALLRKAELRP